MLILSILMALLSSSENSKSLLYKNWILVDVEPKGWMTANEPNVDIIKFQSDKLTLINIEQGILQEHNFELDTDRTIIFSDQTSFAHIESLQADKLVMVYTQGDRPITKTYQPLEESKTKLSEEEVNDLLQSNTWQYQLERARGIMIWEISANPKGGDLNLQLKIEGNNRTMAFPAELKNIEQSLFLSYQIPGAAFGVSDLIQSTRETCFIHAIQEDELSVKLKKGIPLAVFKKVD